jgi:type II secretory ATPase GspE/PulE/Tfp pilus assembly ATPase PilB-like protein
MDSERDSFQAGEQLVKQNLITQEELSVAREHEKRTGTPWYKEFLQSKKVSFSALEDVLRYEFHLPSTKTKQKQLGDALVEIGVITRTQLEAALEEQKRSGRLIGHILLEKHQVSEEQVARALGHQQGIEYARLESMPSSRMALEAVSENIAQNYAMIPVSIENDKLTVLIADPRVRERLGNAGILLGLRIAPLLTACPNVRAVIAERYKALRRGEVEDQPLPPLKSREHAPQTQETFPTSSQTTKDTDVMADHETPSGLSPTGKTETNPATESRRFEEIARKASGATVIRLVTTIIEGAVNSAATDIHLDPQEPEMRVRYRIDGVLHDVMSIPENMELAVISRIKILADLDITETRHPQDGHISMEVGGQEFDVRVATLPTYLGERVVLRMLDQSTILSGIKDLGLEAEDQEQFQRIIAQPYGMVLVTGPTGSGKTTTLYAALNQKNIITDSIVTLEDPVEYQLSGINQVQIDTDIGVTFANTLRAALRQDIDVLLVGEIRDPETAQIAVRAAMTGHLVLSTLHTNDAPEAISTLRNMGVPSFLIASALTAVIAQRLVRRVCANCRAPFDPALETLRAIGLPEDTPKLFGGTGCDQCYHTGNRGRTGIFEILEVTPDIRQLITRDAEASAIVEAAQMRSMGDRCRDKVLRGDVEPKEYLRVIRL